MRSRGSRRPKRATTCSWVGRPGSPSPSMPWRPCDPCSASSNNNWSSSLCCATSSTGAFRWRSAPSTGSSRWCRARWWSRRSRLGTTRGGRGAAARGAASGGAAVATTDGLDLYGLLGVASNATDEEIKRAYRRKAREHHPDANAGDAAAEARFKEVSLAYEVLRDPDRRARYDRFGPEGVFGQGAGGMTFDFEAGLSDIFEAFFGSMCARGAKRGPMPGSDAEIGLRLSFAEAAFGAQKEISIRLPVACDTCGGSGARPGTQAVTCPDCQGAGEPRRIRQSLLGQVVTSVACGRCQGLRELTP